MEQNRAPRDKEMQLYSTYLWQGSLGNSMEKRQVFPWMVLKQSDVCMQNKTKQNKTPQKNHLDTTFHKN